ncbi:SDR family NAD(P)-dependent oxidoreductase [Roseospira goensis]|uniref:NAD(P)-dependent dehydrogenase (Short-subunit alcohol dehydrogenase family) n=1 Tax=Roseospira goensis TaxID=391922 RepID=A0A7W6RX46_9PROT|nr:SDR family NAD(P)-dependent oxidoreductase [Roseospira goensis]MBB4284335.1 NAD(P)-dependent dehydrogenase (short-subunit alcohol dehydrogenase family) [Roseospira goensis]
MPKLIWITGAGRGIGRALAVRLARQGATVVASARNATDLEDLARESVGLKGRIVPKPLDVTDRAAVGRVLDEIDRSEGLPDVVVFNAGTHEPMPASAFKAEVFDRLLAVNVTGAVNGLEAVIPRFIARRRGRIAVVASVAGYFGLPTAAAYGASKSAVITMCEALRPDLAQYGVRLQVINPGFVRTPLTDRNDFPMPFLMEVDAAADRIARGLQSNAFEITFPRRFAWLLKAMRLLPYPVFFALTKRAIPDSAKPPARRRLKAGAPPASAENEGGR